MVYLWTSFCDWLMVVEWRVEFDNGASETLLFFQAGRIERLQWVWQFYDRIVRSVQSEFASYFLGEDAELSGSRGE